LIEFDDELQLDPPAWRFEGLSRRAMTVNPVQADLGEEVTILATACRRLLLRPDDPLAREGMARTIAAMELPFQPDDSALVRGLISEARAHAESLAFRLEGAGYDDLYIRATTALLCQALAHLKQQLLVGAAPDDLRPPEFRLPL
jgi:hypothetical protein